MDTIWLPDLQSAGRSKYTRLVAALRRAIAEGLLKPDQKLLPVRELAFRASVTPGTVARAYKVLVDEGLLRAEVGRGTFVARRGKVEQAQDWPDVVRLRSPSMPEAGQLDMLRDHMRQQADQLPFDDLMSYPGRGHELPLRTALAERLSQEALGPVTVDDMVLCHGGQNGLIMIMQTVLKGDSPAVAVENLAYPGFRRAAELNRARVVGIGCDDEGPLPDELEQAIRQQGVQLFLTSADVNNPTLRRTSMRRRHEIAAVARRYGVHVVDDDCYTLAQLEEEGYRAILPELGWYLSSFSKVLTPALRIGYIAAPERFAKEMARTASFNHFGMARPIVDLGARVLRDPNLPAVRQRIQDEIAARVRLAVNHLGGFDLTWGEGVLFQWLRLPFGWRSSAFVRAAQARGVIMKSSEDYVLRDGRAPHAVRLAINGQVSRDCYEEALRKVRALLDNPSEEMTV